MQGAHAPALQLLLERQGYTYYGYTYYGYTDCGHTYYGHTYYGALQLLLERQGDRYVNPICPACNRMYPGKAIETSGSAAARRADGYLRRARPSLL